MRSFVRLRFWVQITFSVQIKNPLYLNMGGDGRGGGTYKLPHFAWNRVGANQFRIPFQDLMKSALFCKIILRTFPMASLISKRLRLLLNMRYTSKIVSIIKLICAEYVFIKTVSISCDLGREHFVKRNYQLNRNCC